MPAVTMLSSTSSTGGLSVNHFIRHCRCGLEWAWRNYQTYISAGVSWFPARVFQGAGWLGLFEVSFDIQSELCLP